MISGTLSAIYDVLPSKISATKKMHRKLCHFAMHLFLIGRTNTSV